jgi:thiol-disulfide isomerase/thioredoxin
MKRCNNNSLSRNLTISPSTRLSAKFSCSAVKEHLKDTSGWWEEGKGLWTNVSTVEEFQREVLEANDKGKKVFVDWYATWCSGCKKLHPELCKIADENQNYKFVRCSMEDLPLLAKEAMVKTLPAASVYAKGERIATFGIPLKKLPQTKLNLSIISSAPCGSSFNVDSDGFVSPGAKKSSSDTLIAAEKSAEEKECSEDECEAAWD